MDLFMAICQGIGLALAAGAIAGCPARTGTLGTILLLAGVVGGAALFALSLSAEDYSAWPGIPAGAVATPLGYIVASAVAGGAMERAATDPEAGGSPAAIGGTVALVALAIAALATLLAPVSLVFLVAFAVLVAGRRRRADRKYEGLRVLR